MRRGVLRLVEIMLGMLAVVAFAYLVLTGIGWFAVPFALLVSGAVAARRTRRLVQPSSH